MKMVARRHLLLIEIAHFRGMLLEGRLDFLKQKYIPLLAAAIDGNLVRLTPNMYDNLHNLKTDRWKTGEDPTTGEILAPVLFDKIVTADPDIHKKNTQWLLNLTVLGTMPPEDLDKATYYLQIYQKVKGRLDVEQRDLNRYKTLPDLFEVIEPIEQEMSKREADRAIDAQMHEQANVLYNSANYKIVVPLTREASCYFGINTQWCTAATQGTNYFDTYNKNGPIYIILQKATNRRWQFHFASGQFMNERDSPINMEDFVVSHPEVAKAFEEVLPKPVATIRHLTGEYPIYRSSGGDHRLIMKKNVLGKELVVFVMNGDKFQYATRMDVNLLPQAVADMLNKLGIKGNPNGDTDATRYFLYYRDDKWQTGREVAQPILKFPNGWYWGKVATATHVDLMLIPDKFDKSWSNQAALRGCVCVATLEGGFFKVIGTPFDSTSTKNGQVIGSYVVDFLLHNRIQEWLSDSVITASNLPKEDAARLIAKKPHLADLGALYNVKGPTKTVRAKVIGLLNENNIPHTDKWLTKDKLIIYEWASIDDCMDDIGSEEGKEFYKYYLGENAQHYDDYWPEHLDSSNVRDLLQYVAKNHPDVLKRIGEYLADAHPDDVDEIDDYDPTDLDQVEKLYNASNDDELERAFKSAMESGNRSGAEGEAIALFKNEVKSNPYLYFPGKKGKWDGEFENLDGPVIFAVPLKNIVAILDDDPDDVANDGWVSVLEDAKIDVKEPSYGFMNYDDDYAQERFMEELHELLPETKIG